MVRISYLHHCKREVRICNYHDLNFYIRRNYLLHSSRELLKLIQSLKLLTSKFIRIIQCMKFLTSSITKNTGIHKKNLLIKFKITKLFQN